MSKKLLVKFLSMAITIGLLVNPLTAYSVNLDSLTEYNGIPLATGSSIEKEDLLNMSYTADITDAAFGAVSGGDPVANTAAINEAIADVAAHGGGTVIFPKGDFKTYTIRLQSSVNLYLDEGAVIRAAKTDTYDRNGNLTAKGEGGNYDEPEVNRYAGLQDNGHTYFANSLIYGADIDNVMIYGKGLIDGSQIDDSGTLVNVLSGNDPSNPTYRYENGHSGNWFGNKALALVRMDNVVISGINILNGGHFAIIAEGTTDMVVEDVVVDTNRDAYNIDCCQNVTVRNSIFNSLTDDAIVLKASYGAGTFMPTQNVLIEDCTVSGYDAGSVLTGHYTTDKVVANDRCGPTARIKLGTESTCGFNTVTITDVTFDRSRGFCLESVDGSVLENVILTNCEMRNVSSSPIFIRIGDRGRYPVTGNSTEELINSTSPDSVRLDDRGWVLPKTEDYTYYPAQRYIPSYNKNDKVSIDDYSFNIVNQDGAPTKLNFANIVEEGGKYYAYKYNASSKEYTPDYSTEIATPDLVYYANAVGAKDYATVRNVYIADVNIANVDPRYPILLSGLVDSKIENVKLENINVEYRGGLKMEDAIEQRQLNTSWTYSQYLTGESTQSLPWLVNTFFSKAESLLPRVSWNPSLNSGVGGWQDDPYNIPEMPREYPEPSIHGILPAYGIYARHVKGLDVNNVNFSYIIEDERPAVVLDDVQDSKFTNFNAETADGVSKVVAVTNNYKRHTNNEYVTNEPYISTTVSGLSVEDGVDVENVTVNAPAPGTPQDSLYTYCTVPVPANGYTSKVANKDYDLPLTVHRPFFNYIENQGVRQGEHLEFAVSARNPASPDTDNLTYSAENLPAGAAFDPVTKTFSWTPGRNIAVGTYTVTFTVDDGVIPVSKNIDIAVTQASSGGGSSSDDNSSSGDAEITDSTTSKITVVGSNGVVSTINGTLTKTNNGAAVKVDKEAFETAGSGTNSSITIDAQVAVLKFDATAAGYIRDAAESNKYITIKAFIVDKTKLSDKTQAAIGNHPVYEFSAMAGNHQISSFGGGTAYISIPYTPTAEEDHNAIIVYYIDDLGNLQTMRGTYNEATGTVDFTLTHFSKYAIGYNKVVFSDVGANAWYNDAVTFIAARGITHGTTQTAFSPDAALTRGQFIVMLMRAYDIKPVKGPADNFTDAGDTYYTDYLASAKNHGITIGIGNNKFAPDQNISRQDMYTLIYRILSGLGELSDMAPEVSLSKFSDASSISDYAKTAMGMLAAEGIVLENGGKLDPRGQATRAEMAEVLYNILSR